MFRLLRLLLGLALAVVSVVVLLLAALVFFVDAEQYRGALEEAMGDISGYELTIGGSVEFSVLPLGIELREVRLRNPGGAGNAQGMEDAQGAQGAQELGSARRVAMRAELGELLQGRVLVEEISADGVQLNYVVNADGSTSWSVAGGQPQEQVQDDVPEGGGDGLVLAEIRRIALRDSVIDYRNLAEGSRHRLTDLRLDGSGVRLDGSAFPVEAAFAYARDGSEPRPVSFAAEAQVDLDAGTVGLDEIELTAAPLQLEGSVSLAGINGGRGQQGQAALDNISGQMDLNLAMGEVDLDITPVKNVFSNIASLHSTLNPDSNSDSRIAGWPDLLHFSGMSGRVQGGIGGGQELRMQLDNLLISGNGGINLAARRFAYDVSLTVLGEPHTQTIDIDPRYQDIAWPLECSGGFGEPISRYCRPAPGAVRDMLMEMGRRELQSRLEDAIQERLGESLEEQLEEEASNKLEDAAKELLRGILD